MESDRENTWFGLGIWDMQTCCCCLSLVAKSTRILNLVWNVCRLKSSSVSSSGVVECLTAS